MSARVPPRSTALPFPPAEDRAQPTSPSLPSPPPRTSAAWEDHFHDALWARTSGPLLPAPHVTPRPQPTFEPDAPPIASTEQALAAITRFEAVSHRKADRIHEGRALYADPPTGEEAAAAHDYASATRFLCEQAGIPASRTGNEVTLHPDPSGPPISRFAALADEVLGTRVTVDGDAHLGTRAAAGHLAQENRLLLGALTATLVNGLDEGIPVHELTHAVRKARERAGERLLFHGELRTPQPDETAYPRLNLQELCTHARQLAHIARTVRHLETERQGPPPLGGPDGVAALRLAPLEAQLASGVGHSLQAYATRVSQAATRTLEALDAGAVDSRPAPGHYDLDELRAPNSGVFLIPDWAAARDGGRPHLLALREVCDALSRRLGVLLPQTAPGSPDRLLALRELQRLPRAMNLAELQYTARVQADPD